MTPPCCPVDSATQAYGRRAVPFPLWGNTSSAPPGSHPPTCQGFHSSLCSARSRYSTKPESRAISFPHHHTGQAHTGFRRLVWEEDVDNGDGSYESTAPWSSQAHSSHALSSAKHSRGIQRDLHTRSSGLAAMVESSQLPCLSFPSIM